MKDRSKNQKSVLLAASVAGLIAVVGAMATAGVVYAEGVQCSGINGCKGQGECGGKGNSCAGKNACKGEGWVSKATDAECLEVGGKILPVEPPVEVAPTPTPAA